MTTIDGVSLVIGDICKKNIRFLLEKSNNSLLPYNPHCFSTIIAKVTKEDRQLFEKIKKKYGLITTNMLFQLVGLRILIEKEILTFQQEEQTQDSYKKIENMDQFQLCLFLHSMHECGEYSFLSEKRDREKLTIIKQYFFTPPYSVKIKKKNTRWFSFNNLVKKINKSKVCFNPLSTLFLETFYNRTQNLFETVKSLEKKEEKAKINPSLWLFKHRSPIVPPDNYTNTFVVGNQHKYIIDPAADSKKEMIKSGFLHFVEEHISEIEGVILTHDHIDHCNQVEFLRRHYDIPIFSSENAAKRILDSIGFRMDGYLLDNQLLSLGSLPFSKEDWTLKVVNLKGHTKGSIGFLDTKRGYFFSGDFIFENRQTLVDPYFGSLKDLRKNIRNLLKLNITFIHPGHGDIFKFNRKWVKSNLSELEAQEEKVKKCIKSGCSSITEITKCAFSNKLAHIGRFFALAHVHNLEEKNIVIKRGEDYFIKE